MKTLKQFLKESSNDTGLWVSFKTSDEKNKANGLFNYYSSLHISHGDSKRLFFPESPTKYDSLEDNLVKFMKKHNIKFTEIEEA